VGSNPTPSASRRVPLHLVPPKSRLAPAISQPCDHPADYSAQTVRQSQSSREVVLAETTGLLLLSISHGARSTADDGESRTMIFAVNRLPDGSFEMWPFASMLPSPLQSLAPDGGPPSTFSLNDQFHQLRRRTSTSDELLLRSVDVQASPLWTELKSAVT
jgi:hypothetical protein